MLIWGVDIYMFILKKLLKARISVLVSKLKFPKKMWVCHFYTVSEYTNFKYKIELHQKLVYGYQKNVTCLLKES